MAKHCVSCRFCRTEHGQMAPSGSGPWCSNSKSPFYRLRVVTSGGCDNHVEREKKAPFWMRDLTRRINR